MRHIQVFKRRFQHSDFNAQRRADFYRANFNTNYLKSKGGCFKLKQPPLSHLN